MAPSLYTGDALRALRAARGVGRPPLRRAAIREARALTRAQGDLLRAMAGLGSGPRLAGAARVRVEAALASRGLVADGAVTRIGLRVARALKGAAHA